MRLLLASRKRIQREWGPRNGWHLPLPTKRTSRPTRDGGTNLHWTLSMMELSCLQDLWVTFNYFSHPIKHTYKQSHLAIALMLERVIGGVIWLNQGSSFMFPPNIP